MSVRYEGFGWSLSHYIGQFKASRLTHGRGDSVDLAGAVILPYDPRSHELASETAGLYRADGTVVKRTRLWRDGQLLTPGKGTLPDGEIPEIDGKTFFLGLVVNHFGHFLTETLNRLAWLTPDELARYDHFAVVPAWGKALKPYIYAAFEMLGIKDRIIKVRDPMRFASITASPPAITLHDQVHERINTLSALVTLPTSTERNDRPVFLSRTEVGQEGFGRALVGEYLIEKALEAQGVDIVHPETMHLNAQVELFRSRHTIIGFAGSGLHTLLLAGGKRRMISYTARKLPHIFPLIDAALDNDALYIRAYHPRLRGLAPDNVGFKPQLLDPAKVLRGLHKEGVIADFDDAFFETAEHRERMVRQYNAYVLLRRTVEFTAFGPLEHSGHRIQRFLDHHDVDMDILRKAAVKRPVLRPFFGEEPFHHTEGQ